MNWFQINSKTVSVPAETEPGKGKKEEGRRCDDRQSVKRRKQWIIH